MAECNWELSNICKNVVDQVWSFFPNWFDGGKSALEISLQSLCSNSRDHWKKHFFIHPEFLQFSFIGFLPHLLGLWDPGASLWRIICSRFGLSLRELGLEWRWIWVRMVLHSWPLTKKWWTASRLQTGEFQVASFTSLSNEIWDRLSVHPPTWCAPL